MRWVAEYERAWREGNVSAVAHLFTENAGYRVSPMVKLDVLVAGDPVDALCMIVHKDFAYER